MNSFLNYLMTRTIYLKYLENGEKKVVKFLFKPDLKINFMNSAKN